MVLSAIVAIGRWTSVVNILNLRGLEYGLADEPLLDRACIIGFATTIGVQSSEKRKSGNMSLPTLCGARKCGRQTRARIRSENNHRILERNRFAISHSL
eukprot:scaffold346_cov347-Pavlova_lutheri.AAC.5